MVTSRHVAKGKCMRTSWATGMHFYFLKLFYWLFKIPASRNQSHRPTQRNSRISLRRRRKCESGIRLHSDCTHDRVPDIQRTGTVLDFGPVLLSRTY